MRRRSILALPVAVPGEVGALDGSPNGGVVLEASLLDELARDAARVLLERWLALVAGVVLGLSLFLPASSRWLRSSSLKLLSHNDGG